MRLSTRLTVTLLALVSLLGTACAGQKTLTLSLGADTVAVAQSLSGTVQVTVTPKGTSDPIHLALVGAPAGVTGKFAPNPVPEGTANLMLTVGADVAPSQYTMRIRATAGTVSAEMPLILTVTEHGFTVSLDPGTVTLEQGTQKTAQVLLVRTAHFSDAVDFTLVGAPENVTGSFADAGLTGNKTTLTLAVGPEVGAGSYPLTVRATGGVRTVDTPLTLTVTPRGFTLATTPAALQVEQTLAATATLDLTRTTAFTEPVTLTVSGAPEGVTVTYDPDPITGDTTTLAVAVAGTVAPGSYLLTLDAAGGNRTAQATLGLEVTARGFTLTVSPTTVTQGETATLDLTLTRTPSFTEPIALDVTGVPGQVDVAATFDPNPATGDTATLTVAVTGVDVAVTPGTYQFRVRAQAAGLVHEQPVDLVITGATGTQVSLTATGKMEAATDLALVAYQDGVGGEWRLAEHPGLGTYHFYVNDPEGRYGVAAVCGTGVDVYQATLAETHQLTVKCETEGGAAPTSVAALPAPAAVPGYAVDVTVTGLAGRMAEVHFGGEAPVLRFDADGTKRVLLKGNYVPIAVVGTSFPEGIEGAIIRMFNVGSDTTYYLDFGSAEVVPATPATLTFAGPGPAIAGMTGSVAIASIRENQVVLGETPSANTALALDYQAIDPTALPDGVEATLALTATADFGGALYADIAGSLTSVLTDGGTFADPATFGTSTVTLAGATWAGYTGARAYFLDYASGSGEQDVQSWHIGLSPGWLGTGDTFTYARPDLTGLPGWSPAWELQAGATWRIGAFTDATDGAITLAKLLAGALGEGDTGLLYSAYLEGN